MVVQNTDLSLLKGRRSDLVIGRLGTRRLRGSVTPFKRERSVFYIIMRDLNEGMGRKGQTAPSV